MKTYQTRKSILTSLKSYTPRKVYLFLIATAVSSVCSNLYAGDNSSTGQQYTPHINSGTSAAWIKVNGHSESQLDILQWEVSDASSIAYFTIECSRDAETFTDLVSIHPSDCADVSKAGCFTYAFNNTNNEVMLYYKIKITFRDNNVIESDIIYLKEAGTVANLEITEIKNQNGQISLTFKSPKAQNATLNLLDREGRLLAVKNISATEGNNTYTFDAGPINSLEMLIFSLNNQDEQIVKKYMIASAW